MRLHCVFQPNLFILLTTVFLLSGCTEQNKQTSEPSNGGTNRAGAPGPSPSSGMMDRTDETMPSGMERAAGAQTTSRPPTESNGGRSSRQNPDNGGMTTAGVPGSGGMLSPGGQGMTAGRLGLAPGGSIGPGGRPSAGEMSSAGDNSRPGGFNQQAGRPFVGGMGQPEAGAVAGQPSPGGDNGPSGGFNLQAGEPVGGLNGGGGQPANGGQPDRNLVDCLHTACAELASACENDPDCIRLESCFQMCFSMEQNNCINRCLQRTNIDRNSPTVDIHRPLFDCGRQAQCYRQNNDGNMGQAGPCPQGFANGDVLRNIPYSNQNERHILDLYLSTAPGPNPLFIWIHGGGWRAGSHSRVNAQFLALRQRGYSIASIEYRLSDHPWPTPVVDVKAAVRWLRANAAQYNLDAERFIAAGSSAGGHLVSMLGTSSHVGVFEDATLGNANVSSAVQLVVNFYGPTQLDQMDPDAMANMCPPNAFFHDAADSPESTLLGCRPSLCRDRAAEASPITHVDGSEPPFMTLHGTDDCTVPTPQGRRLHTALTNAGVESVLIEVDGAGHNVNECLAGDNYTRMVDFIERRIRNCPPN